MQILVDKTGRPTSGAIVISAGGAISWFSQRQSMVATSTTEAKIVVANIKQSKKSFG